MTSYKSGWTTSENLTTGTTFGENGGRIMGFDFMKQTAGITPVQAHFCE